MAITMLCVAIVLGTTWRVSKDFIFGSGGMQFAQLRRPPADEINLGFISIPIQKWQYLQQFTDVPSMLETLFFPASLMIVSLLAALLMQKRIRSILFLLIAITIPIEGAIVLQNGVWFPTGYAFLHSIFIILCSL